MSEVKSAMMYLQSLNVPKNGSIIFDIDDTLIRSYRKRSPGDNGLIQPVKDLYDYARYIGLQPFIVTNRDGTVENTAYTHKELERHGIVGYDTVYFRDPMCTDMWVPKLNARKHIYDRGYVTVMSVGDMPWDIGQYGGYGVLLPS